MQHAPHGFLFSPSDLTGFLACEHLTQLDRAVALGERARPRFDSEYAALLKRKGEEHERLFLEGLRSAGRGVTEVGLGEDRDFEAAARATAEAIRTGAEYIYQAVFLADGWRGLADFLERVERPSALGPFGYQVLDTKLARHPQPEHALQLCFYSSALGRIQGVEPEFAAVVLGTRERVAVRLRDVSAYYRRLVKRFESAVAGRGSTSPYPCEFCSSCDFHPVCEQRWEKEDHLARVALIRRDQVGKLSAHGIGTLTRLAEARPQTRVPKMRPESFLGLREQAALQLDAQRSGRIGWRELPVEPGRGFAILPPRSPGDLVLDFEGHPFFEPARGLEFLFGVLMLDREAPPRYETLWAHGREAEKLALEGFVDRVRSRLAIHPDLHVYHYGAHEPGTIKRLMGEHATREEEIDELLRGRIFVDLLTVLRQALRAGVPSYSLKEIESLFGFERSAAVGSGTEAILRYERWLETADFGCLEEIAAYNEEDCRSTLALLDWLHGLRPSGLAWPEPPAPREVPEEETEASEARRRVRTELLLGAEAGTARWLAAEILEYHRREARPAWWHYFARCEMSPEELVDDTESIGGLEDAGAPPETDKRSLVHTLRFPVQDHKLGRGQVKDPSTGKDAGKIVEIDDRTGILRLKRGPGLATSPLPRALIDRGPYDDREQRAAVLRVAESIRAGDRRYPALEAILGRELPRINGRAAGAPIHTTDLEEMKGLALGLDGSTLFLQGPPGTGKTWSGARLVVHLLSKGKRIGIASQSHKAIHNLLDEIEKVAGEERVAFRGLKKSTGDHPESAYEGRFIRSEPDVARVVASLPEVDLLAGTAWLFARGGLDGKLDHLVIDEAGQVSLADAVAMGASARNVILLGDPLQLAQVSQGTHPEGSGVSVLEHLLGNAPTIPEDRGVFLEESFRMHPDVCGFISEVVYAGRLHSHDTAARRGTSFGTGIRFLPVEHEGNRRASEEEVSAIRSEIDRMLGGTFTDEHGVERPLCEVDFMVVAPYNAQVQRLRAGVPSGVRVGTVDKFQGQEAPVVFFSMATSSGEDVPRNLSFLFSRNRLNVAISRAQCLAFLVCSPRLLEARCSSIEEMQLVNALCSLVEYAEFR